MYEETGLRAKNISVLQVNSGFRLRVDVLTHGEALFDGSFNIDQCEIQDARFFSVEELPSNMKDTHREIINNLHADSN